MTFAIASGATACASSSVHQHLRRAGLGGYPVDEALGRGRIGRVTHRAADAVEQFLQPLLVAVDSGYRVPGIGQGPRSSPAKLSARADHDRHPFAPVGRHLISPYLYGRACDPRRPSSAQPETTTPSPTKMANPSTVLGALAPRSSATPAPITGTESPT
jgi:hypothetical protein